MTAPNRNEAQQRVDEIRIFQRELSLLAQDGVLELSDAQAHAVSEHHNGLLAGYARAFDIDTDVKAKQLSLGMRAVSYTHLDVYERQPQVRCCLRWRAWPNPAANGC